MFQRQGLEDALTSLGAVLESRSLSYDVLAIGGSSLLLLGLIGRATADLDVVGLAHSGHYVKADPLPAPLTTAAEDVARALELPVNWLNSGPASLMDFGLPEGFEARIEVRQFGALRVHIPGRADQICFKLYAAVDRGERSKHYADLLDLQPSKEELMTAARWAITHDTSQPFREELVAALNTLGVEIGNGAL